MRLVPPGAFLSLHSRACKFSESITTLLTPSRIVATDTVEKLLALRNLNFLNLEQIDLSDAPGLLGLIIKQSPFLARLLVGECRMDDDDAAELYRTRARLFRLDVSGSTMSAVGFSKLASLTNLEDLTMNFNEELDDAAFVSRCQRGASGR